MLWQIIVAVLLGALSGWIASKIMKSKGGFIRNVILGIIGGGWVMSIILAVAGACLIIWLARLIFK